MTLTSSQSPGTTTGRELSSRDTHDHPDDQNLLRSQKKNGKDLIPDDCKLVSEASEETIVITRVECVEEEDTEEIEDDDTCTGGRSVTRTFIQLSKQEVIRAHYCEPSQIPRRLLTSTLFHVVPLVIGCFVIYVAALIFRGVDFAFDDIPFVNTLFFSFTSVTTIGYGDNVPRSVASCVFCFLFLSIGVPSVFLVLHSFSEVFAQWLWILWGSLCCDERVVRQPTRLDPLPALILLQCYVFFGCLMFCLMDPQLEFIDAWYFCFISVTTIGFGDIVPTVVTPAHTFVYCVYMAIGIVVFAAYLDSLTILARRLHYFGRQFCPRDNTWIKMNGNLLTAGELIKTLASDTEQSAPFFEELFVQCDAILNSSKEMVLISTSDDSV